MRAAPVKVLVTGGAGYLGTELVAALAQRDEVSEVVVYDNLARKTYNLFISEKLPAKPIRFVLGDMLDTRKLRDELRGVVTVFHCAAMVTTPFGHEDPHGYEQVNHWGTAELSYLLEESEVRRVVYTSTTSVYGARDGIVDLGTDPDPHSHYGMSKLRGERMLERLNDQLQVYIVRCGNVYGYSKSMRFDAVINRFMFEAQFNRRITIHGNGEQRRSFVHVHNAAGVHAALGLGDLEPSTYNLVEKNLSIMEIAETLGALYEGLEMLFIQQDMKRRNLEVAKDPRLDDFFDGRSFVDELREFKEHFAFSPA